MIIHLLAPSVYSKDYYSFLNRNFSGEKFVIFSNAKRETDLFNQAFDKDDIDKGLIPILRPFGFKFLYWLYKSDAIIIHGLFNIWYTAFLALNPWLLKKCNWVVWGGDLYSESLNENRIKGKIRQFFKRIVGAKIGFASILADDDLKNLKKRYGFNGHYFKTKYPTPLTRPGNLELLEDKRKMRDKGLQDRTLNIMIGNSATRSNQHKEALDILSKYRDENIKIYLPLSYGIDSDYKEYGLEIIKYAVDIFGEDKVVPLLERLDGTEYYKIISEIDVGVFNCNRQQGMGNITILLASGAKVYLRSDTSMWNEYLGRGNVMFDIMEIPRTEYHDFLHLSIEDRTVNAKIIYENASDEANKIRWGTIFSVMTD
ncbi:MAG: TDP-N-acetylfucosamine:lipid II N-acetylfucosaminyltransferase [Bacteroides thetaiotaomicron]|nr:TDP-N-acetylfucosamine:lipid II N-acetylfucosaminyltransferase [Bacteroides thetaiotaomicron]